MLYPFTAERDITKTKYCQGVIQREYIISSNVLGNMVNKLPNGKAPGNDMIFGYWYKYLQFYKNNLIEPYTKKLSMEIIVYLFRLPCKIIFFLSQSYLCKILAFFCY